MDSANIAVVSGGVGLSLGILWFFFGPRNSEKAASVSGGVQEIRVLVKGGYSPDRIAVKQGQPVRLLFERQESNPCTEQVILADFAISRALPQGQTVPIEFTPQKAGEFIFHCGMNMVRGTLVVTD